MPRKKQNVGDDLETWVIKGVDPGTRMRVKMYAALNNQTTAQALSTLIDMGFAALGGMLPLGLLSPDEKAAAFTQAYEVMARVITPAEAKAGRLGRPVTAEESRRVLQSLRFSDLDIEDALAKPHDPAVTSENDSEKPGE